MTQPTPSLTSIEQVFERYGLGHGGFSYRGADYISSLGDAREIYDRNQTLMKRGTEAIEVFETRNNAVLSNLGVEPEPFGEGVTIWRIPSDTQLYLRKGDTSETVVYQIQDVSAESRGFGLPRQLQIATRTTGVDEQGAPFSYKTKHSLDMSGDGQCESGGGWVMIYTEGGFSHWERDLNEEAFPAAVRAFEGYAEMLEGFGEHVDPAVKEA